MYCWWCVYIYIYIYICIYIYIYIYIYKNFCPSKIGLTWSNLFSVNLILTQQARRWTSRKLLEFYDPITTRQDKKITWLVSETESTFETGDLGLICNTGPYRTNGQSCGWHWPSGVRIRCYMDVLTRDRIIIDTVWEDWHYINCLNFVLTYYFSNKSWPLSKVTWRLPFW